jgi:negative regulator of replication initiation
VANDGFGRAFDRVAARRRAAVTRGVASIVAAVLLAVLALLYLLYTIAGGWRPLPLVSFAFFWSGVAWAVWRAARLLGIRSGARLAGEMDGELGLKGLIAAAFEFDGGGDRLAGYSEFLRSETVRRAAGELHVIDPGKLFVDTGRPAWGLAGIGAGFVLLLLMAVSGGREGELLAAISDPTIYFSRRSELNLIVTSKDRTVLRGSGVSCEAVNFGAPGGSIDLRISSVPGVWKRIEALPEAVMADGMELAVYRHRFDEVQESFHYRFESADCRTEEYRITVVHRPVINRVGAQISFPRYTGMPPETLGTLAGRIYALSGSNVKLVGETSKPVTEGLIDFARAPDLSLSPAPGGFTGSFYVTGDDTFTIGIVDTAGLGNEGAIRYPIVALDDMAPAVEIVSPVDGAYLPLSMEVLLEYEAADDFGLAAVRLYYLREGKDEEFRTSEIPLPPAGRVRDIESSFVWSLADLGLFPGDAMLYYLEVVDNNTATGPSVSRTVSRRLVVPSLGDLYESISDREALRREGLGHIQEESREIRRDLKNLLAEYQARGTFDWSRRREAESLIERHEELMQRIRGAGDQLGETLERLEENRATSQEIGEKLAEIRDLLDRIESDQLKNAIERFRERLGEVSAEELVSAMNELDTSMEDLARRLEQTAELLRRIMREERLEELIRRMESMLAEQRDIRDSGEDAGELARKQEELLRRMEDLDRDLGRFEEETGGSFPGWQEMLDDFEMGELAGNMSRAADNLLGDDREAARRGQNEAIDEMLALYTSLARFQFSMNIRMSAETARRILKAARQLLEISGQQEDAQEDFISGGESAGQAERQLVIREAIRAVRDQLYATETMAISNAVFMHLGRALYEAERVIGEIERRGGRGAAGAGRVADGAGRVYENVNLAAVELLRISAALGSGEGRGNGGKMQSLTQSQLSIDGALREMLGAGGETWSMEARARMARIAAEQRRLEDILDEILQDATGTQRQLGRLDDLGEEMIDIAERLEKSGLDDELLEREERILSRLLESQRSLTRRDYEERRTSSTAADLRASAQERMPERHDETEMILDMIRKGMRERGPVEYEQLIRHYFRALARKVRSKE